MEVLAIAVTVAVGILGLYQQSHMKEGFLKLTPVARISFLFILGGGLVSFALGQFKDASIEELRNENMELVRELASTREDLVSMRATIASTADDLETARTTIASTGDVLKSTNDELQSIHASAVSGEWTAKMIRVDDPDGVWHDGVISIPIKDFGVGWVRREMPTAAISNDIDSSPFISGSRTVRAELVNVRPADLNLLTIFLTKPDWVWGPQPVSAKFVHGDVVAISEPTSSSERWVAQVDGPDYDDVAKILKRNPAAAIRLTILSE